MKTQINLLIDQTNTNDYVGPGKYDVNIKNKPKSILNIIINIFLNIQTIII